MGLEDSGIQPNGVAPKTCAILANWNYCYDFILDLTNNLAFDASEKLQQLTLLSVPRYTDI